MVLILIECIECGLTTMKKGMILMKGSDGSSTFQSNLQCLLDNVVILPWVVKKYY